VALSRAKRGQGAGAALAWRMEGAGLPQKDQKRGVAPLLLPLHRLPLPMVVILIPTCKSNTLFPKYLCFLLGNLSHTDNALLYEQRIVYSYLMLCRPSEVVKHLREQFRTFAKLGDRDRARYQIFDSVAPSVSRRKKINYWWFDMEQSKSWEQQK
jgi:hypothetical protein